MHISDRQRARFGLAGLILLLTATASITIFYPAASEFSAVAEVRQPAAWPGWPASLRQLRSWPRRFDAYVADAFPGRSRLITWGNTLLWRLGALRSSQVIEGREGWLYLGNAQQQTVEKSRGLFPFDAEQARRWVDQYERVQSGLAGFGAELRLVVIPDKQTVYPAHLPEWARPGKQPRPTMTDRILGQLADRGVEGVLDLRPVLREAGAQREVFWRTDSHWNPAGARVALERLVPWLVPEHPATALSVLARCAIESPAGRRTGDLARILGVTGYPDEPAHRLTVTDSGAITSGPWETVWRLREPFRASAKDGVPGKLLVLGDSFLDTCWFALAELSGDTVFFGHQSLQLSRSLVEQERPATVLVIIVERLLPENGPELVP